jgi:hypothetical protein
VSRRFGYDPRPHHGDHFPRRPSFPTGGSHTHLEVRHLDGQRFSQRGSRPTRLNCEDFGYWKNQTRNYLLSQGRAIWEIVQKAYMIPATLNNVTQGELQRYKNNYKSLNLITTALDRNVYDRVHHLETAHDV